MSRIFISYSHKDEVWKDRLESYLNVFRSKGLSTWTFRKIEGGADWWKETGEALHKADVAVLLISVDFLNSRFIEEEEIPPLLERRQKEGVVVFPIIVRPCPWKQIEWLASIQCRPKNSEPLSRSRDFENDLTEIVVEILEILKKKDEVTVTQPPITEKTSGTESKEKPEKEPQKTITLPTKVYIECHESPIQEWVTPDGIYLQTEANEWISWTPEGDAQYSLFTLRPTAAAVLDEKNQLVAGLYDSTAARLKGDKWEYIPWNHAVLSLARTDMGIVVGDSGGNLDLLKTEKKATTSLAVQEPITDIININDDKLVVLGAKGGLWITEWPFDRSAHMKPIDIRDFERIYGLIESTAAGCVLLLGANRVASLDCETGKIKTASCPFEDNLRNIYPNNGKKGGHAVLTDEGGLYLLSDDLTDAKMIKISVDEGRVTGVRPLMKKGFLAWTTEGNLYRVRDNGTFKQIADNNVVLAFPDYNDEGVYIVHWHGVDGVHIQYEYNRSARK